MKSNDKNFVTLMAGGDMGCHGVEVEANNQLAELILPTLRQADLRFGQCENIYSDKIVQKGHSYPGQPSIPADILLPTSYSKIWQIAGIDLVSLASNITMKMGPEALLDTIELFQNMGKHAFGAGKDIEAARKPAIVECNGVKIAFLSYCSVLLEGHEAGQGKVGCAPMRAHTFYMRGGRPNEDFQPGTPPKIHTVPHEEDLQALKEDIKKAKQQADAVVMSIHWGIHHIPKCIAAYQPLVAHAAIDAGADLILGHHPHCLKAVEIYKGKVCFYSLGNFMITTHHKRRLASNWNLWDLWWYRLDPECLAPDATYQYSPESRNTMIAKVVFSKKGVERVSFLPAFINPKGQPAVVPPENSKFREIVEYMEWLSDQFPHEFRVEENEVIVVT